MAEVNQGVQRTASNEGDGRNISESDDAKTVMSAQTTGSNPFKENRSESANIFVVGDVQNDPAVVNLLLKAKSS